MLFWVSGAIFGARDPRFTVSGPTSKLVVFCPFSWAIACYFGFRVRFLGPVAPVHGFRADVKTCRFRVFWPFPWAIAHCFGFRIRLSWPVTAGARFQGVRQNSSFSRFMAVFVGFSTLFRIPGAIFGDRHPRFTISGPTSKHIVFAFSGRFVGYSTIFWAQ